MLWANYDSAAIMIYVNTFVWIASSAPQFEKRAGT